MDLKVLTGIKEVVVTLAALAGAIVALVGLTAWRRQLAGKHEYEVALNFLRSAYKVRDAIATVRHPIMSSGEQAAALAELGLESTVKGATDFKQERILATAATYQVRWKAVLEAAREMDLAAVEGEVLWGEEATVRVRKVRGCVVQLQAAIEEYLSYQRDPNAGPLSSERNKALRGLLYCLGGESDDKKDPLSAGLQAALRSIEEFVRPKLK
jgi:hypothetical protein